MPFLHRRKKEYSFHAARSCRHCCHETFQFWRKKSQLWDIRWVGMEPSFWRFVMRQVERLLDSVNSGTQFDCDRALTHPSRHLLQSHIQWNALGASRPLRAISAVIKIHGRLRARSHFFMITERALFRSTMRRI